MEQKRDYYQVLGVDRSADDGTIKKAYRKLAKRYHPDTNAGDAEAEKRFKEVTEAYNVLSDKEKRRLYDQFGHAAFDGQGGFESGAWRNGAFSGNAGGNGSYREYHFEGGDMEDILKNIFGGGFGSGSGDFQGEFGGFRGDFGGFQNRRGPQKGEDLRAQIRVTFDEAAFGCEKVLHLESENGGNAQSLQVKIPAGIDSGKTVRLRGKGRPGRGGGQPGDLLLEVSVGEKPGFERKGMDIYSTVRIPFSTAVLGGEVPVRTIYGDVLCKIREGTQPGTKIRLRGKGIVSMKDPAVHGDQYVQVEIQVPARVSPEAKQKLKEFDQLLGHRHQAYR